MIMNNENKKLSRNKKRKTERKFKMDDKMKLLLSKIKSEKKTKNKSIDTIKQLENELVEIKCANNPNKLQSELKELNKTQVIVKNLHEIKNEILVDYTGEFEMVFSLKVGHQVRQTHIRFRKITDYEAYINSIDKAYDAEVAIFNDHIYKIITPLFNLINKSQYGNSCDSKHQNIEYRGKNCFIPTKGNCFVKCINFITGEDYKQQYPNFIRKEKRRLNVLIKARIQPFFRANNINLGYFDGIRVFPRSVTDRDNALFLHSKPFCLIWKSEGVSFNPTIKELIDNFKIVDFSITE